MGRGPIWDEEKMEEEEERVEVEEEKVEGGGRGWRMGKGGGGWERVGEGRIG